MFSPLSVLVCEQDFTKTTELIFTKLGWTMDHSPEWTQYMFCMHVG